MSVYNREEVAAELEASKEVLATLQCERTVSHAINIVFSHIRHLENDAEETRRLSLELYTVTTRPAVTRAQT